ncbi:hypothetical protein [Anaerotruncus rubiinfantis]|uniref:hypothetical protein n=1 Tax=Anaerotruncus rubiinfantis TaxID=1720200 RepID=UPI003D796B07
MSCAVPDAECIKDFMLNLDASITRKNNGRIRPIKMRHVLLSPLSEKYSSDELYAAFEYCYKYEFFSVSPITETKVINRGNNRPMQFSSITKHVQPVDDPRSPRSQHITGINPCGYEFLRASQEPSLWKKIKELHLLDKICTAVSAGAKVVDLLSMISD